MCQKLAVLGKDILKNQPIALDLLSKAHKEDAYLSVIYQSLKDNPHKFSKFAIKDSVLYKIFYVKHFQTENLLICLPDIMTPAAVHTLHVNLGHPSISATIKSFQANYYNRRAAQLIRLYIQSCHTCTFATKPDTKN